MWTPTGWLEVTDKQTLATFAKNTTLSTGMPATQLKKHVSNVH